jgi:hypothetical protein
LNSHLWLLEKIARWPRNRKCIVERTSVSNIDLFVILDNPDCALLNYGLQTLLD